MLGTGDIEGPYKCSRIYIHIFSEYEINVCISNSIKFNGSLVQKFAKVKTRVQHGAGASKQLPRRFLRVFEINSFKGGIYCRGRVEGFVHPERGGMF